MPNLETATSPLKLRRIAIDPLTRVEGHGKVTILLDEENKVHQVRLHIVEIRGLERFIQGRPNWEVPVIVERLCGICPVSHHLAAAKAMDIVAGYGPLPPTADKLRRLMHYGQMPSTSGHAAIVSVPFPSTAAAIAGTARKSMIMSMCMDAPPSIAGLLHTVPRGMSHSIAGLD